MVTNGWAIYVFTLTSDLDNNSEAFDLIRSGTTSIYVRFGKNLPHGVNMVVYGELGKLLEAALCLYRVVLALLDSLLMLDSNRTLTTDMTT